MQLVKLSLSGFRSWERITYEFQEGLTIFCGVNGAGKSSIRLGAQYAIAGAIPGLKKTELVKGTSKTPFSVELLLLTDEGKKLLIRRTLGRTVLSLDGVDASVRENSFLSRLRTSLYHTFLSPDQSAFVDVQDFKRKEMLYALIPEVEMLRTVCVPRVKEAMKTLYTKKGSVNQNIYTMDAVIAEQKNSLMSARRNYEAEQARIRSIKALLETQLPYKPDEIRAYNARLEELQTDIATLTKFCAEAKTWAEAAVYTNTVNSSVINTYNTIQDNIAKVRNTIASYNEMLSTQSGAVPCSACGKPLVCAACDTPVQAEATVSNKIRENLAAYQNQETRLLQDLATQANTVAAAQVVDAGEIQRMRQEMGKSESIISKLREEQMELNGRIRQQQIAQQNVDAVSKIQMDTSTADAMKEHIIEVERLVAEAELTLKRKRRTVEIMNAAENRLTQASNAMNTTLPSIYFDHFLTRLTTYCNYLLETISTLEMDMKADDAGISITVNGMSFNQLSSGEKQRVRIATTLAFSLLSKQSDTLFIDEVFDSLLDAEGVEILAHLLSTVICKFYTKVIVVSHQPYLTTALKPDHIIMIDKDEDENSQIVKRIDSWSEKTL